MTRPLTNPAPQHAQQGARPNAADVLVRRTTIVAAVADLAIMALIGEVIPPLAAFVLLTVVLLAALRRRPAGRTIALGILAVVANLGGLPFWTADLLAPGDTVAFAWTVLSAGSRFVAVVASVLASRRPAVAERGAHLLRSGAIGLLAVAAVVAVVARATAETEPAAAGDIAVNIEDFDFPADPVTVTSGGTLHVTNEDPARHTFTVDGTDVDELVLGGTAARVDIDLAPGTYAVLCAVPGHDAMTGVLEVE